GYPCAWRCGPPSYDLLIPWAAKNGIVLCFEYNGSPPASAGWPTAIRHVRWIVDHRLAEKDVLTELSGTDHVYCICHPSVWGLEGKLRSWSILLPGGRENVPTGEGPNHVRDFSVTAYIPPPLNYERQIATLLDGRPFSLGEFLADFPPEL